MIDVYMYCPSIVRAIIENTENRGVRFNQVGEKLRFEYPQGILSEADIETLRKNKQAILDVLRERKRDAITKEEAMSIDRVKKYEWREREDDDVEYTEIPIEKLRVDHTYQRDGISNNRVLRIARSFNRQYLGVLTVAKRNGLFYVIDGQHRLEAAKKRNDVHTLPCAVIESRGIKHEANGFKEINEGRGEVSAYHRYKAAVAAEREPESSINEWAKENGFVLTQSGTGNGKRDICFIGTLVQKWKLDKGIATGTNADAVNKVRQ